MFTVRMIKLLAVLLDRDAERVTKALLREGVMQFIDVAEFGTEISGELRAVSPQVSMAKIADMRRSIEAFLNPLGIYRDIPKEVDLENRKPVVLDDVQKVLDSIANELEGIRGNQQTIQQEILKLEDIQRQLEVSGLDLSETALETQYTFISFKIGKIPKMNRERFSSEIRDIPSVAITTGEDDNEAHILLVHMKRDTERIEKILQTIGWVQSELHKKMSNLKADVVLDLEGKLDRLRSQQDEHAERAKTLLEQHRNNLLQLWVQLRVNELFYSIQSHFKRTSRTMIFSGWLPASKKQLIENTILKASEGRCYFEWHEPEGEGEGEDEVPVQLKNPRFLAPFQMLVTNFGVPEYGTIDPTPFVMVAYLVMFGLMFADVGQGAVLAFLGFLGTLFFKGKKASLLNLSKLIVWCGCSSMATGVLFGSYFGMSWFPPVWFDFHGIITGHVIKSAPINDIFGILAVAVYFGIAVIGCGLLFNWINLFSKRRWVEMIVDKGGLLGGWIFGGGIYVAFYMVAHGYKSLPPVQTIFFTVGLPAFLFYSKGPLEFSRKKRKGKTGRFGITTLMNFGMQWIVELLEVFSGYLSNTLSFMRVAGLGIAHASLMIAFFELARMADGGNMQTGYSPWAVLILITGNILVIVLEGLTAGIQALRLNYYEFFTKFFRGSGEVFSPISLRSREE
jgi:V/A-type H+-transporting ATPase subunit I